MFSRNLSRSTYKKVWQYASRNMSDKKLTTAEKVSAMSATDLIRNTRRVSDFNKRILVFVNKYKTTAEIPDVLPAEVIDKAQNKARIKVANIMIVMTLMGCLIMIFTGKKNAERGETVSQRNLEWHKEYNEKAKKEEAARAQHA